MVSFKLKRVVITGLGAITPLGNTVNEYWQGLLQGRSGIGPITLFDASRLACRIAAQVKDFDPCDYLERKNAKRMDRFAQFAVCASQQAIADAGIEINELNATSVGVLIGTGFGGIKVVEDQQEVYLTRGPDRCSSFMVPMLLPNMAAGLTAIHTGAKGPNSCTVTACAAGSNAIGEAFRLIQWGYAQAMICGGTEAPITSLSVAGFAAARALSTRNQEPTRASRPFDRDRDGFVMGEGSGILLLEELEHAQSRGARIYAEIVGYGLTCDAYHMTAPNPNGQEAARAMELALKDAGLYSHQVDYINAHGTSTLANDVTETLAIKKALGKHAPFVAISSTKSMTGHLLGASGGIEAVATVMTVATDKIPPTINLDDSDPGCDLDYVPKHSRVQQVEVALSNSFGFGGHNVALTFKKFFGLVANFMEFLERPGIIFSGTGSAVPSAYLDNHQLSQMVDTSDDWITSRTGIRRRHLLPSKNSLTALATQAAQKAIAMAGLAPTELNLIILATSTPDDLFGSASLIQAQLGAIQAVAFDLTAACSGFVFGLVTAAQFIRTGVYQNILLIGADALSRWVDWSDRSTCVLFGDAAGAVVLQASEHDHLLGFQLHTDGTQNHHLNLSYQANAKTLIDSLSIDQGVYQSVTMNGQEIYRFAVQRVPEVLDKALFRAGLTVDQVDWLLIHQANQRILDAVAKRLGIPAQKIISNIAEYGNTSAASVPLALDEATRSCQIQSGDVVAIAGFGAGLSWGAAIIQWS